jgi:hypothetical protein
MDGKKRRKPWLQRWDEPEESFARFLHYRNLGPCRSLNEAYRVASNGDKLCRATGQWGDDSRKYKWVKRAAAWDVHKLSKAGDKIVMSYVALVEKIIAKALAFVDTCGPERWPDVLSAVKMLNGFITYDALKETVRRRTAPKGPNRRPVENIG